MLKMTNAALRGLPRSISSEASRTLVGYSYGEFSRLPSHAEQKVYALSSLKRAGFKVGPGVDLTPKKC
jgi:hypothetical protein